MIVPHNRLLFWTGAVVIPFSGLSALVPAERELSAIAVGLLLLLVLIDASLASRGLRGIKIEFPEVVRLSRGRKGLIRFVALNENSKTKRVRIGLVFPSEICTKSDSLILNLQKGDRTLFQWDCTPMKRGSYCFDLCYLEGTSPLGFWAVTGKLPINSEIRVYPDFLAEKKHLASLFLNRGNFGIHTRRQVGQGRDFEKLREYVHGDSYEHIHWKVTAKRGRPVTKVFQIEKTQEVYVIIDASRLSSRSPAITDTNQSYGNDEYPLSLMERFVTSALVMGTAAHRQGDLFGILTFSDRVRTFIRAKSGAGHFTNCREALLSIHPEIVNPDFGEIFSFIGMKIRRRSLLIFLTSLDDPALAESFISGIDLIARKHLVMVNMLRPAGVKPLFSDSGVDSLEDIYRALGGHLMWQNLGETGKVLERRGVRFTLLENETMCSALVSQYMELKQRQLL
jgi:uncharacterized protein (DUF58 family)